MFPLKKTMLKKAQLTLFIILGIMMLMITAFLIHFKGAAQEGNLQPETQKFAEADLSPENVKDFVNRCIRNTAETGIYIIARNGGYVMPENKTEGRVKAAYFGYGGGNVYPSAETVREEISSYVASNLFFCTQNFNEFRNRGWNITDGSMNVTAVFTDDGADFTADYPLALEKNDLKMDLNGFHASAKGMRISFLYDIAADIAKSQADSDDFDVGYFERLGRENNVTIDMAAADAAEDSSMIFFIEDPASGFKDRQFVFRFAVKG